MRPVWRSGEYVSGAPHKCGWERESRRDEVRPHGSSEQPYPFLLGDFELDRPPSFLLDHNGSGPDTAAHRDVIDL